jgi:hypothetical protein
MATGSLWGGGGPLRLPSDLSAPPSRASLASGPRPTLPPLAFHSPIPHLAGALSP